MKDRNNLEQQLADKLGNKSITPSGQAWDRIVRNREEGKDKKKKKRTYIYYAAAIVLLMLFGSYFFMLDNNNVKGEPQIVTTDAQKEAVDEKTPDAAPETEVLPKQREIAVSYEVEKNTGSDMRKEEVATITGVYKEVEPEEGLTLTNVTTLQEKRVLTKEQLYEQEADYLLKNAVKDLAADKQFKNRTNDAALLKEVEGEMNEYYREKAMSIFSLKNKKIRFAVKD